MTEEKLSKYEEFYAKNYKKLLIIPLILLIFSITVLVFTYTTTGDLIKKDVSIAGGISATITVPNIDKEILESRLKEQFPQSDIVMRSLSDLSTFKSSGIIVDISEITSEEFQAVVPILIDAELNENDLSIQETSSSLGSSFFKEMMLALLFAFLLMAIVVFVAFRKLLPCIAIILSPILEIITTLAILILLDIRLSTAGIVAFLLIIGYSIDTDILLTTRVLKRKGDNTRLTYKAMKTGLTMTITTIAAALVALIVSNSPIVKQMFLILTIALTVDIIATWLMNAPLLTMYVKKNETHQDN